MSNIQDQKIFNYIKKEVEDDKIIHQDFLTLKDYGLEFKELVLDIKKNRLKRKLDISFTIDIHSPFFTNAFKRRKNIENISFQYKNYEIKIEELTLEGQNKLSKNFEDTMNELQSQMRKAEDEEKEAISSQMKRINEEQIIQKESNKKLINEIEITINEQLKLLKKDIQDLKTKIEEMIEQINFDNSSKNINDILNNFRNERVKKTTIRNFENNFKLLISSKKLDLSKLSTKIKELYLSMSLSRANEIPSILSEARSLKFDRELIKEEYDRLKSFKSEVFAEIHDLVSDEFENLILEALNTDIAREEIIISKMDLYKLSLPRYKKLLKAKVGIENA